ncbi:hypothetical protein DPMN_128476 [Dreissena polymorpha]|uniref:Contactin n=1 Tax=Dreissena polymorpha TaxID=45954 RepID=A0A9D4H0W8_DREPO|nr:hypothetical protein DPMN_128476 [Dreissena polymorpha]
MDGCPLGWEFFNAKCYMFVGNQKLIIEEADADCWHRGGALISISDVSEHQFVVSRLRILHTSDEYGVGDYFTSGSFYGGQLFWDSELDTSGRSYWVTNVPPPASSKFTRIAYVWGGSGLGGYGWNVVPSSRPASYICEMTLANAAFRRIEDRSVAYGMDPSDTQHVKRGPLITEEPKDIVVFPGTPSTFIECKAEGYPTYKWRRVSPNGEFQDVTSAMKSRYTLTGGRFTLQSPVETEDQGSYQCSAQNEFGVLVSKPGRITFGFLKSFSPVPPERATAKEFEGYRIACQAPSYYPEVRYSCGYLYFSDVQETDNKKYFCLVTLGVNELWQASTNQPPSAISLGVWLDVLKNNPDPIAPVIYTHTYPSPPIRGATIRIECIAYGTLPLIYTWRRKDGRPFEPGTTISDFSRVLTIPNAEISAEGDYECTVKGTKSITSKVIALTIESRPYFPFGIGDRIADPDKQITWRCKAVGRPMPTYTWFKDGELLQAVHGEIEIQKNVLVIRKVNENRDQGMYQCGASNLYGTTYSYGQLKVLRFAPSFARHPMADSVSIPEGGNFTIRCDVEGAPEPEVIWLKNGAPLGVVGGNLGGNIGMTVDFALVLSNIVQSDAGLYTCQATNSEGQVSSAIQVKVVVGIIMTRPPSDESVLINRTAFIYCQAGYNAQQFDVMYVWRLNGHVINVSLSDGHYRQEFRENQYGLYILNAQYEHAGYYECQAMTTIHSVRAGAMLRVYGPPGAPAGVYVFGPVDATSARLVWTIGSDVHHGSLINFYDVEAEMHLIRPNQWEVVMTDIPEQQAQLQASEMGFRQDQRTVLVDTLLPDISYRFRLRASNSYGKGQEASRPSISIKTDATAPLSAPTNIRGNDEGKVGTLNIQWDALDVSQYGSDNVGYNIYFKKKNDAKEFQHAKVAGGESKSYTHLVGLENYYLEYTVKIGAYNDKGSGPNSTETGVMSAEGMPLATVLMGDCNNYNGSAFSMAWNQVEDTREKLKGRLKGYRIRYYEKDVEDHVWWYDVYGQADSAIIIGLKDNTNYWASVQVMNYAGVGPQGEYRLAETFHLPPQQYPRHVKVFPHTQNSVRVTWQEIMTYYGEEMIQGYIIRVWKVQEDIRSARDVIVDVVSEAIVDGLQTKTVYVLRVLGFSIGGDGHLSPHVYFTVEGQAVPFDPTTTRFCFDHTTCRDSAIGHRASILTICVACVLNFIRRLWIRYA